MSAAGEFTMTYAVSTDTRRRYFFRELWRTRKRALLLLPVLIAAVLLMSRLLDQPFWGGLAAGIGVTYVLLLVSSAQRFGQQSTGQHVTTTITDRSIRFESEGYTSEATWTAIRSVRATPDGLVVVPRLTGRPVLIPASALRPEIVDFVLRRFGAANPGR